MIREDVVFDFANALREISRVERVFDQAFGDPIPVTLDARQGVRDAERQIQSIDPVDLPVDIDVADAARSAQRLEDVQEDITRQVTLTADEYREVVRLMDQGESPARAIAAATDDIRTDAERAEVAIRDMGRVLGISEDEARELANQIARGSREASEQQAAFRQAAIAMGLGEDEARDFVRQLERATGEARQLDNELDDASRRNFAPLQGNVTRIAAGLTAGIAAVRGFSAAFRFVGSSLDAVSDAEESINKVNVVFGDLNDEVLDFNQNAPQAMGLSIRAANEAASTFGNLFISQGLTIDASADMSTALVQLAADLASFNNIDVEEALTKLRAGLVGSAEPLRTVGVALTEALVAQKAFELGLADANGELSEAAKIQARYALIIEQSVTAQGDFIRTSDGIANRQRILNAEVEQFREEFGEALLPVLETFLELAPDMLDSLSALIPSIATLAAQMADGGEQAGFLLTGLADLPRGFAAITDVAVGAGNFITAPFQGLVDLVRTGDVTAIFDQVIDGYKGIGRAGDNIEIRVIEQDVIDALRNGASSADAFLTSLIRLNEGSTLTADTIDRFQTITSISPADAIPVLTFLINNQDEIGLTEDAVRDLKFELLGLQREVRGGDVEEIRFRNLQDAALAAAVASQTEVTALEQLRAAAAEADTPLLEFVAANEDVVNSILGTADPFDQMQVDMELTRLRAEELFRALQEGGQEVGTFPIFEQLPETLGAVKEQISEETGEIEKVIDTSAQAILDRIREQNRAQAEFESNLIRLAAEGFGGLAERLRQEGPGAASAAQDFLSNIDIAAEAEQELTGTGTNAASLITSGLATDLEGFDFSSPAGIMVLNLAQQLENPELLNTLRQIGGVYFDEIVAGMTSAGPIQLPGVAAPPPGEIIGGRPGPGAPTGGGGNDQRIYNINVNLDNFSAEDVSGATSRAGATAAQIASLVN